MLTREQISAMFDRAERLRRWYYVVVVSIGIGIAITAFLYLALSFHYPDHAGPGAPPVWFMYTGFALVVSVFAGLITAFLCRVGRYGIFFTLEPGMMLLFSDGTLAADWGKPRYLRKRDLDVLHNAGIYLYSFVNTSYRVVTQQSVDVANGQRRCLVSITVGPSSEPEKAAQFYQALGMTKQSITQSLQQVVDDFFKDGTFIRIANASHAKRNDFLREAVRTRIVTMFGKGEVLPFDINHKGTYFTFDLESAALREVS